MASPAKPGHFDYGDRLKEFAAQFRLCGELNWYKQSAYTKRTRSWNDSELPIVCADLGETVFHYAAGIRWDVGHTKQYGGLCRERAFVRVLDMMIRAYRCDKVMQSFYLEQRDLLRCEIESSDDDEENSLLRGLHNSYRDVFETYANMKGIEEGIIQRNKNRSVYHYVPIHTKATEQGALLMEALPYTQAQLQNKPS